MMPLWRNRNFTIFWLGQGISIAGSAMAFVVLPLLVYQTTGSVAQMGQITALFGMGNLSAGIVGGMLADRLNRRYLMMGCDMASAILYAIIPFAWFFVGPHIFLLYIIAAPLGFLNICSFVVYTASVTNLVEREQLTTANSRLQATFALSFVIGPLLAGFLAGLFGPAAVMAINAATYLVSVVTLAVIRLRIAETRLPKDGAPHDRVGEVLAGLRFIARHPVIRWTVILRVAVLIIISGAFDLFIFRLKHELHQNDGMVGIIFGLDAVGSVLSALATPFLRRQVGFGVAFLGGLAVMGVSFLIYGMTTSLVLFAAIGIGFTFGDTLAQITGSSLRQELTPNYLQGRVTAVFQTFLWLGSALGTALTTALAARLGTTLPVFFLLGALMLALAIVGILTPARTRHPEAMMLPDE